MADCFAVPEIIKAQSERILKPIIDVYELEEFDQRISYSIEYNLTVKSMIWCAGFTSDIIGGVHYVDPISHELRIEAQSGEFHRIAFEDVIGVVIVD